MTLYLTRISFGNCVMCTSHQGDEEGNEIEGRSSDFCGWYSTEDGRTTQLHMVEEDDFRNNGGVMNHEMVDGIQNVRALYCRLHRFRIG